MPNKKSFPSATSTPSLSLPYAAAFLSGCRNWQELHRVPVRAMRGMERLKNDGSVLAKRYFEEQLQRIRVIRLSERKFYQKITDISWWFRRCGKFACSTSYVRMRSHLRQRLKTHIKLLSVSHKITILLARRVFHIKADEDSVKN